MGIPQIAPPPCPLETPMGVLSKNFCHVLGSQHVALINQPEKHELEQSEKNLLIHPALEIEEDEEEGRDLLPKLGADLNKNSEREFCIVAQR